MPVPGPRTQMGPVPGYANPQHETPDRINPWEWPHPIVQVGRSPGTMTHTNRGNVLAAGQVRQMWRVAANYIGAQRGFSWTESAPGPGRPVIGPGAYFVTRALRYMTRSTYARGGADNTRYVGLHTQIKPKVRSKPVTLNAGGVQNRPTVRNRLTSFGSRVPPINAKLPPGVSE